MVTYNGVLLPIPFATKEDVIRFMLDRTDEGWEYANVEEIVLFVLSKKGYTVRKVSL